MLRALGRDGKLPLPAPRACLAVLVSIAGFTLVLPRAGLIPAALVAVMIATRGDRDARLTSSPVLAVCVGVVSWIVFVEFHDVPMPAFRMPAVSLCGCISRPGYRSPCGTTNRAEARRGGKEGGSSGR